MIKAIHKCQDGVEIISEEERGFSKRRYIFSVVISKDDLNKIIEEMDNEF